MTRKDILNDPAIGNKAEAFEAFDDIPTNPNLGRTIGDVINARYGRRDVLRGMLGVSATTALFGSSALMAPNEAAAAETQSRYKFEELTAGNDETHHVAEGYDAQVLLRWGDPVLADAPDFDVMNQTAAAQLTQFGYNNDYVGFVPLNEAGTCGLLCVNHEYTNEEVMFPGLGRQDKAGFEGMTAELIDIEMAAHGGTVVEIAQDDAGNWAVVRDGKMNRRVTPLNTAMVLSGPAAGHKRMKTNDDPAGMNVIGTINNCAGGMTPWGTWLMAEENFHGYFWTDVLDADGKPDLSAHDDAAQKKRYGVPGRWYAWGKFHDRYNIDKEPNMPNKFGWVVEVDPMDPTSTPIKHTALGRFRHEGAETTVSKDGKLVVYMGDDNRFDYQYKYVSKGSVSEDRAANAGLLSDGTLYVARFDEDGSVTWMPLVHGTGPLTAENGFNDQGDVLIDTRLAADLLGATPMDRPEDAQPRGDGTAYIMLTNNNKRKETNAANPRNKSDFGHIIEIKEDGADHAATRGTWSILVKCGDPSISEVGAQWNPETSENGWFGSPDNCAMDADGRLWVSTDQGSKWGKTGKSDGLYAVETEGTARGTSKLFFRCPVGGEMCGPYFTDDGETLFLAVQHPGTDGTKDLKGFERASTFEDPATRWPDFDPKMPPRPSVVVVTKKGGGKIAV
ncbi:PhoX family phosphatase [Sulfitobacter mediterraneus]|uniref:PhoX family protein n=1 Tax=Sulfitobacter mediterraneus TaxID=83219 RepID=UPI001931592B|nr:PhoX family phosphatase [Sulfitobacter mediterraneus]MBM1309842.1 PhoX family phosphatase [Sulfitobacter mediterraneus]MBM1313727.1 PhoX family phosphatase [Sulfitobacter mediterraneus]MBM1322111.1 PhoX family phosphatase [Sulfitobacter mediterraneus]MBM1325998.1 PhoX family phosphatase [Sulfitobacter mediterraneus]MBM1397344.1 PhoX family phosphatase [Sulfitobacter mediterraneus]